MKYNDFVKQISEYLQVVSESNSETIAEALLEDIAESMTVERLADVALQVIAPETGSCWRMKYRTTPYPSETKYTVLHIANIKNETKAHPILVVYEDQHGNVETFGISEFNSKMEKIS